MTAQAGTAPEQVPPIVAAYVDANAATLLGGPTQRGRDVALVRLRALARAVQVPLTRFRAQMRADEADRAARRTQTNEGDRP